MATMPYKRFLAHSLTLPVKTQSLSVKLVMNLMNFRYIYILASSQSYTTSYQGTGPEDGQRAVGQVAWSRLATHPEQSGVQVTTSLSHSPPSTNQSL